MPANRRRRRSRFRPAGRFTPTRRTVFSIAAPGRWIEASPPDPTVKLHLQDPLTDAAVSLGAVTVPTSVSLDEFARENVQALESDRRIHGPIVQDRLMVPAGEAWELRYRFISAGIERAVLQYFILRTGAAYVVAFVSLPQDSKGLSARSTESSRASVSPPSLEKSG